MTLRPTKTPKGNPLSKPKGRKSFLLGLSNSTLAPNSCQSSCLSFSNARIIDVYFLHLSIN